MSQRYKAIEHLVVPSEQVSKLLEKLREIDDEENVIKEAILLLKEYRDICAEVRSE